MKKKGKYLKYLTIFPTLLVLTSCDTDELGNSLSESIEAKLFPNIWAFLVQFLAFVVLIVIVIFFAYKPVKKYLDKRKELLENERKDSETNSLKAKQNLYESEKKLAEVRDNATNIINEARQQAKKERDTILTDANQEASKIKENAYKAIEDQKNKAKASLKNEIVDVALSATSKLLEREVNDADSKNIVNEFVSNLENKKEK